MSSHRTARNVKALQISAAGKIALFFLLLCGAILCACSLDDTAPAENPSQDHTTQGARESAVAALLLQEDFTSDDLIRECTGVEISPEIDSVFCEEALDPNSFEKAWCAEDQFCFLSDSPPDTCAKQCAELLEEKGWVALEEANEHLMSFVEASGHYRSLVVQYIATGEKTSVLITANE